MVKINKLIKEGNPNAFSLEKDREEMRNTRKSL